MSYFSSKSTWLSLVDTAESENRTTPNSDSTDSKAINLSNVATGMDGITLSFEDFRPCFPTTDEQAPNSDLPTKLSPEDLDYLKITRDLRHRLFFYFKEWEFGPALLDDHIRLAQAESNPEEALSHYCYARHVAVTLIHRNHQESYILALLEADRLIAEIHNLLGNHESCTLYAREGLTTIKKNHFQAPLDMRITKLTVRFLTLLERKDP